MSNSILDNLKKKLHPQRFPGMSPLMAALVGWLVNEEFTNPSISAISVTSDGFLLVQKTGDIGFNDFIGDWKNAKDNFDNLFKAAELNQDENDFVRERINNVLQQYYHTPAMKM